VKWGQAPVKPARHRSRSGEAGGYATLVFFEKCNGAGPC